MSKKNKLKARLATLKLDEHHKIQRFGVMFSALVVSFVLLFAGTSTSAISNGKASLDSTALYTPSFTTSKTRLSGEIPGIYVSKDRRRALVMMRFEDNSTGSFSTDASQYQAFIAGSNQNLSTENTATKLTGQIVVFGSTGYMGVVVDSDKPFEQQVLNLTVRANSELVAPSDDGTRELRKDLEGQNSFAEHDQWRVYFNPAAKKAQVADSLNGSRVNPSDIYGELVIKPQETEVRKGLDDQLRTMSADLARISEYESEMDRTNVDGVSIRPPQKPTQIDGDQITGDPATEGTPSTQQLDTDWVEPNGFDFNWRDGSVREGYLDELVPTDESYVKFLSDKAKQSTETTEGSAGKFSVNDLQWKLTDGSDLKTDYDNADTTMKPLRDIMNKLSDAYQTYYNDKTKYQVDSLTELLNLEVQRRNVESSQSVNTTDEALVTY